MTPDDLERLLDLGHEVSGVEFKPPGPLPRSVDWRFAQIIRAVIGMANRRDGGNVVIGVEERNRTLHPVGLTDDDLQTWVHDDLMAKIKGYVAPFVNIELEHIPMGTCTYVVLSIAEFDDVPVLCDRDWSDSETNKQVLTKGHLYVRSRGKPETTDRPTQVELRELLDIAVERGVEKFVRRARRGGIWEPGVASTELQPWTDQLSANPEPPSALAIRSKGHWEILIRPVEYHRELIPFEQLLPLVLGTAVSFRGWNFPHLRESDVRASSEWIECETEWQYYREEWRFFQSGQFQYLGGIPEDWVEDEHRWGPPANLMALGPLLGVTDTLARYTEAFEFAGRLAGKVEGWGATRVQFSLRGLKDRRLWFENPARGTVRDPVTSMPEFRFPLAATLYTTDVLLSDYRELGRRAAAETFKRFGLDLSDVVLQDIQREAMRFGNER